MLATTRDLGRGAVAGALLFACAAGLVACSDGAAPDPGSASATPGDQLGAPTLPGPAVTPTDAAVPLLSKGFDCRTVRAAEAELDRVIGLKLTAWGLGDNSRAGFDATFLVTAAGAADYWGTALTRRPASLDETADRVIARWRVLDGRAEAAVAEIDAIADPSDADLRTARVRLDDWLRQESGARLAADERELRNALAGACG